MIGKPASQSLFEFSDPALKEAPPHVLGLWKPLPAPAPSAEGAFFDTVAQPTIDAPVWRTNLPPNPALARSMLEEGNQTLKQSKQWLDQLSSNIRQFERIVPPSEPAALMFTTEDTIEQIAPGLSEIMDEVARDKDAWQRAAGQLQSVVDATIRTIIYYAWVETKLQDQIVARSAVGWLGDTDSFFLPGIGRDQAELHQRSLGLAIKSRAMLIRTLITAIQLSTLIATGNPVLALPIAWRYINHMIADVRAVRTL